MLVAYNVVLIDKLAKVSTKSLHYGEALQRVWVLGFSRTETEYIPGRFSQHEKREFDVRLDGIVVPKCKQYRYVGFLCQEHGMIDEDVTLYSQD